MTSNKNIISKEFPPEPTLRRLPWYLAYLGLLRSQGVEYVSSTIISKAINVDASQIAKDLSVLNVKGKTRIGYQVAALEEALQKFLGFGHSHKAVMLGAGSLGSALIADIGLSRFGLDIVAGFDTNPKIVDTEIQGIPIYDIKTLSERQKKLHADIAIIAVPIEVAQQVADLAVASGIKAIWNFTPFRIHTAPGIVIQNTSIYAHLAVMYNRLNALTPNHESDSI